MRGRFYKTFLCLVAALFVSFPAHAEISVELAADRTTAEPGESISLTVRVSGTRSNSEPVIRGTEGFRLEKAGSSSQYTIAGGQFMSNVEYGYALTPSTEGSFTIGPAVVTAHGVSYQSKTLSIRVSRSPVPEKETGAGGDLFLTARLSASQAYPGQEVLYTVAFYQSVSVSNALLEGPSVQGVVFKQIEKSISRNAVISGKSYEVTEISYAASAEAPGAYSIPPCVVRMKVFEPSRGRPRLPRGFDDGFFGMARGSYKDVAVSSEPITLTVLPFPESGRPADFGGLVGEFSINAGVAPQSVPAGGSATVTLVIKGAGNVRLIPEPAFPVLPDVKVYADKPVFAQAFDASGTTGEKTLKWALVPQAPGRVEIPPFRLSVFDPRQKQYKTLATSPLALEVLPGEQAAAGPAASVPSQTGRARKQVELLGQDILPIHESLDGLAFSWAQRVSPWTACLVLLVPLLPLAGLAAARRTRRARVSQAQAVRAKKAGSVFAATARRLSPDDAPGLHKALSAYLVQRLEMKGGSPTPQEAERMLVAAGVEPALASRFREACARLEARVFSQAGQEPMGELKKELMQTIKKINKRF